MKFRLKSTGDLNRFMLSIIQKQNYHGKKELQFISR